METQKSTYHQIQKIGAVSGILSIVFYFSCAVLGFLPGAIARLMAFSFPLLWIISFMGLYDFLKKQNHTPTLEIAYLFGHNIAKSPNFNKILGWSGSFIALGLLVLNLITFPNAPAESGLFDLGPFLGLWSFVTFIWFAVVVYRR